MAFLDKNQDVIQVRLTQFGKTLLSQGAWKPAYYQFFDDSVIYDAARAGMTEAQNDIQARIKLAPITETRYLNHSLEDRFELETKKIEEGERDTFLTLKKNQKIQEREGILRNPINKCSLGSQNAPLFSLKCFDAEINTTVGVTYSTASVSSMRIPQFNINATYRLQQDLTKQTNTPSEELYDSETYISLASEKVQFLDNTTIEINPEDLAILLEESNVPLVEDGFTIEFFELDDKGNSVPIMTKEEIEELFFIKKDADADKVTGGSIPTRNFFMSS